jgi:hypothetical protein
MPRIWAQDSRTQPFNPELSAYYSYAIPPFILGPLQEDSSGADPANRAKQFPSHRRKPVRMTGMGADAPPHTNEWRYRPFRHPGESQAQAGDPWCRKYLILSVFRDPGGSGSATPAER